MQTVEFKLSDEEKLLLKQLAEANGTSVSAFVRECIREKLPQDTKVEEKTEEEDEKTPSRIKDRVVDVYLCEADYQKIKKDAGRIPMSTYIRNTMVNRDASKYVFEVNTDDLDELNETMAEINMYVNGFIGALRFRNDIFPADIEAMEKHIAQANDAITALSQEIYKNRENIRKDAKKYLHNRINKVVKSGGAGEWEQS